VRHRLAPFIALLLALAAIVAACGSSSSTSPDPYKIVTDARQAVLDPVQVNVGFEVKDGATTVTVDPSAFGFVVDHDAKKGAVHISVPTGSLGLAAKDLTDLGVTGSTLDFDLVYDGQALYARSPILATVLTMVLQPSGDLPSGDLTGWLRLGTKEDLAGLLDLAGGSGSIPSFAAPSPGDVAGIKTALTDAGITLTLAGTEKHDGADAYHLTVAVDGTKLLANKIFDSVSRAQLDEMTTALKEVTLSGDVWIEVASNRVVELDGHIVAVKDATQTANITIKIGSPDGTVPTTAPSTFVEIPVKSIVTNLMTLIGQGLTGG
jgi:hypothetical protein